MIIIIRTEINVCRKSVREYGIFDAFAVEDTIFVKFKKIIFNFGVFNRFFRSCQT